MAALTGLSHYMLEEPMYRALLNLVLSNKATRAAAYALMSYGEPTANQQGRLKKEKSMEINSTIRCRQCNWKGKISHSVQRGSEFSGDGMLHYNCPNCDQELATEEEGRITLIQSNSFKIF